MANAHATFLEGYWYASITTHQGHLRHVRTRARTRGEAEKIAAAFQRREDEARRELEAAIRSAVGGGA